MDRTWEDLEREEEVEMIYIQHSSGKSSKTLNLNKRKGTKFTGRDPGPI